MKSRKVKSAARSRAFMKNLKSNIPLEDYEERDAQDSSDDDNSDYENESEKSSEEEVLPITDDESESFDEDNKEEISDEDNKEEISDEEDDLPDINDWGKKKSIYFSSDFVDKDRGKTYREEDEKLASEINEAADLQIQFLLINTGILDHPTDVNETTTKFVGNYDESNLKTQQLMTQGKECNEISEFLSIFKEKFMEHEKIVPLINLKIDDANFSQYLLARYQILSHYLANLSCFLLIRSAGPVAKNHPIYTRLDEYKELIDKMNSKTNYLKKIDDTVEKLKKRQEISSSTKHLSNNLKRKEEVTEKRSSKKKRKLSLNFESDRDSKLTKPYPDLNLVQNDSDLEEMNHEMELDSQANENTSEKRTVTYQIAKNKGLVPRRKKEYRNPRVHHRMKYRKAKIRRKGQVRNVVKEMKRYAGEPTGIAAHVVRSVKLN